MLLNTEDIPHDPDMGEIDIFSVVHQLAETARLTEELGLQVGPYLQSAIDTEAYDKSIGAAVESIRGCITQLGGLPGVLNGNEGRQLQGRFASCVGFFVSDGGAEWIMEFHPTASLPGITLEIPLSADQLSESITGVFGVNHPNT